jgi:hypothetical protein
MALILTFISLLLPTLAGYVLIIKLDKDVRLTTLERLPLSFGAGVAMFSVYLFVIGIAGANMTLISIIPFYLAFIVLGYTIRLKLLTSIKTITVKLPPVKGLSSIIFYALALLITWKVFYILFSTLGYPSYFNDAITTWDYKAKAIYFAGAVGNISSANFLGGSMLSYPPGIPLMRAWMALVADGWSDQLIHLFNFTVMASMVTFLYATLRRHASPIIAIAFCYALISLPLLSMHASSGYADIVVGFYLLLAVAMLVRWFHTTDNIFIYMTIITGGFLPFTKNEGLILFIPVLCVTFLVFLFYAKMERRRKIKTTLLLTLGTAAIILPWVIVKGLTDVGTSFKIVFHPEAFIEIARLFLWEGGSFSILWVAALVIALSNPQRLLDKTFLTYFLPTILSFSAVLAVFILTPNYEWLWLRTTTNRTLLIITPLVILSVGVLVAETLSRLKEHNKKDVKPQ